MQPRVGGSRDGGRDEWMRDWWMDGSMADRWIEGWWRDGRSDEWMDRWSDG